MSASTDAVSAMAQALETLMGIDDVTVAKYLLSLYDKSVEQFRQELSDYPDSFVKRLEEVAFNAQKSHKPDVSKSLTERSSLATSKYQPIDANTAVLTHSLNTRSTVVSGNLSIADLKVGETYRAQITNVQNFGAFATLIDVSPKTDGLIHVSELGCHAHPCDVVHRGDLLNVRLIKIDGRRLSLSLKPATKQQLNAGEEFEIKQLVAAGAVEGCDVVQGIDTNFEAEENVDVEVMEATPEFLKDDEPKQTERNGLTEGFDREHHGERQSTLERIAAHAEYLSKRRREKVRSPRPDIEPNYDGILTSAVRPVTDLPVTNFKETILDSVRKNPVVVIVGETGSGKTTQIPQFLDAAGFTAHGMIACTQPRRVAAISVAKRVASEMETRVGEVVGYTIRFEDRTSHSTRVKYMTEGMLEREAIHDLEFSRYSVIMLDEAHERTVATDILLALLRQAVERRPELRVIVTSATLDSERFSAYFGCCPILNIPGRVFPVDIVYNSRTELDYLEEVLLRVMQVHISEPEGDILVFLTGQEEIEYCCNTLRERVKRLEKTLVSHLVVLPIYANLPADQQARILAPALPGSRKVVLATNIAETSLTIEGIRYVVDSGLVKQNMFDPHLGIECLRIVPISRAQANQRAGRAGRTGPGKCYRLYSQEVFEKEMPAVTIPEIQRQNLTQTVLFLKHIDIDLLNIELLDNPSRSSIRSALRELFLLDALNAEGRLTALGRQMAQFPLEPAMAKALIRSSNCDCFEDMLSVMAMLTVPSVFYKPSDSMRAEAERRRRKFYHPSGDHLTLLRIYNEWKDSRNSRQWCSEHFIHDRSMWRAQDVRRQLADAVRRLRITTKKNRNGLPQDELLRVLCSAYFRNIARKSGSTYRSLADAAEVAIHPNSSLFGQRPEYVLYHSLILTTREYMHGVSVIRPGWLLEAAPNYFKAADGKRLHEPIKPLYNPFSEHPDSWRISAQKKLVKYESRTFG